MVAYCDLWVMKLGSMMNICYSPFLFIDSRKLFPCYLVFFLNLTFVLSFLFLLNVYIFVITEEYYLIFVNFSMGNLLLLSLFVCNVFHFLCDRIIWHFLYDCSIFLYVKFGPLFLSISFSPPIFGPLMCLKFKKQAIESGAISYGYVCVYA